MRLIQRTHILWCWLLVAAIIGTATPLACGQNAMPLYPGDELCNAIDSSDWNQVDQILSRIKLDVNAKDRSGNTAIYYAILEDRLDIVKKLLARGALIDEPCSRLGYAPLFVASIWGKTEPARTLLDAGASIDKQSSLGTTAIWHASKEGQFSTVKLLAERGAKLDISNDNGWRSLHFAADDRNPELVEFLVAKGARTGDPICDAAMLGDKDTIQAALLKNKNAVNAADSYKWQPLHWAAAMGHDAIVELLLNAGADPNGNIEKARQGPLHLAALRGRINIVALLLKKGADVSSQALLFNYSDNALTLAIRHGHREVSLHLIASGADVNAKGQHGNRPINFAVAKGMEEVVKELIGHGADINAPEFIHDRTPLHIAALYGQISMAALLIDNGANVNALDRQGKPPLSLAKNSIRKNPAMIELLIKHGAHE